MKDKILGFHFEPVSDQLTVSDQPVSKLKIPEVRAFRLGKARLSWNTAALEFTETVVRRCFSK